MALTYVCSPLSAPTRAEMLANAAKASTYMMKAEQEFGNRAVAPHAYLPFLLDDTVPEERALALEFGQKLLAMCTRLVVYGDRISSGMSAIHVPRRRTGPLGRANSSTAMPISANGMTYAPLPMSAPMPRCSHLSSTPSIGRIDSRHSRPTMPQIAPHTGRDRIGPSSSGCGCAARLPLGALFVDFLVVVFLAAKTFILQLSL